MTRVRRVRRLTVLAAVVLSWSACALTASAQTGPESARPARQTVQEAAQQADEPVDVTAELRMLRRRISQLEGQLESQRQPGGAGMERIVPVEESSSDLDSTGPRVRRASFDDWRPWQPGPWQPGPNAPAPSWSWGGGPRRSMDAPARDGPPGNRLPPVPLTEDRGERLPPVSGVSPRGWGLVRLPDSESSSLGAADDDSHDDPYPVVWSANDPYTTSAGRGYDVDGYRLAAAPDFSTPTPRSFREALRPFEFPAPYIEDQLESVDRRLGAQDMQMLELREKFDATEKQLAEATKKLDDFQKGDWISSKIPRFTDGFRFTGAYLRTGYGINGRGGGIEEFTAPDGLFNINFRLGNEKDTYGEMGFEKSFNHEDDKKPQYMVRSMFAYKFMTDKTNYTTDEFSDLLVRETYVRASNLIQGEKDTAFWAGQRFYDRADIHINDLFALDNSGWGGGVENINLGYGKLWIAALGGTRDGYRQYNGRGTLTELHLDFRLKDVKALEGTTMFWLDIAYVPGGSFQAFDPQSVFVSNVGDQHLSGNIDMINYSKSDFDNELGFAIGLIHDRQLWGGANRTFLMHGVGAGADFNTYIVVGKPPGAVGDQDHWFFANWNVRQFNDSISMMWMVLFDQENVGQGDDGKYGYGFKQPVRRVYSAGARPYFMFSDHFGISGELGLDLVDEIRYTDKAGDGTFLQKATIAPVIKKGRGFWDRPELRVFATHAWWGNNAKGLVANPAYGDVLAGWNFGIQGEAWW